MQGILTGSCLTSFITSQRRLYGRVDFNCLRRSRYPILSCNTCSWSAIPLLCYYSVYQGCPFIIAGCFLDSRRATKRYFSATLRIFIFQLGPQTRQGRGAHMGVSKQYVEEHRNVRRQVLVGERTASGPHFVNPSTLNHHNYKCRRIVIYYQGRLRKQRSTQ